VLIMGRSTQITTWRRFTAAEKKAYRARVRRRKQGSWSSRGELIRHLADILGVSPEHLRVQDSVQPRRHHFADNLGSRVPTMRVNGDVL
jgi:hypothetical protein